MANGPTDLGRRRNWNATAAHSRLDKIMKQMFFFSSCVWMGNDKLITFVFVNSHKPEGPLCDEYSERCWDHLKHFCLLSGNSERRVKHLNSSLISEFINSCSRRETTHLSARSEYSKHPLYHPNRVIFRKINCLSLGYV